ncbi:glycosyltransferase family 4 protein [Thermosulfurimonas sp.]|uniref:glycosyltransferase family 4 protein n=1 Tax=Thermosulfurimonas sp. TaxID=2080236 RepID=UPI0025F28353|nr:glycosyltransferase family 4 protein [Thermosulfurimonas sp.]
MRVLLILNKVEPKRTYREHILKAFKEKGWETEVLYLSGDPSLSPHQKQGLKVHSLGFPVAKIKRFHGGVLKALYTYLKKHPCDIVWIHRYRLFYYLALIHLLYPRFRIVFHVVAGGIFRSPGRRWAFSLLRSRLSALVVNSTALKREILGLYPGLKERLTVIFNGVDLSRFSSGVSREGARLRFGLKKEGFLFGMAAAFRPEKNHLALLRSFREFKERGGRAGMALAGSGPLEEKVRACAASWGLNEVVFLGALPYEEIPLFLRALDVFVHPSLKEGMPNAVLEAMAAELPIIATDAEGVPDIFDTPRKIGYMIPRGSEEALTQAMEEIYGLSPEERREMGREARLRVEEAFSAQRQAQAFVELFASLGSQSSLSSSIP